MHLKNIAIYCGATMPPAKVFQDAAVQMGTLIAKAGIGLVFGGSACGTMKLVAGAALANGGRVTGVFPDDLPRDMLMSGLTSVVFTHTLAERKARMIAESDALIALPGSYGTWDELFDALGLKKLPDSKMKQPIAVLNTEGYYDHLLAFIEHSFQVGFTGEKHRRLLLSANTPEALLEKILNS